MTKSISINGTKRRFSSRVPKVVRLTPGGLYGSFASGKTGRAER